MRLWLHTRVIPETIAMIALSRQFSVSVAFRIVPMIAATIVATPATIKAVARHLHCPHVSDEAGLSALLRFAP